MKTNENLALVIKQNMDSKDHAEELKSDIQNFVVMKYADKGVNFFPVTRPTKMGW